MRFSSPCLIVLKSSLFCCLAYRCAPAPLQITRSMLATPSARCRAAVRLVVVSVALACAAKTQAQDERRVEPERPLPEFVQPLQVLVDTVTPVRQYWRDQVRKGAPYVRLTAARALELLARRIDRESDNVGAALRLHWEWAGNDSIRVYGLLAESDTASTDLRDAARDLRTAEEVDFLPERGWLPVRNSDQATCFFGGDDGIILPGIALAGDQNAGVLGADLYSDYMGGARITLSSALSAATDGEDERANALRFIEGGGTIAIGATYPLWYSASLPIPCGRNFDSVEGGATRIRVLFSPRFGADLPVAGTAVDNAALNVDLGGDLEVRTHTVGGLFRFFGHARVAVAGGSSDFYTALGLSDGPFFYSQATGGVIIANAFRLSWSFPVLAPEELNDNLRGFLSLGLTRPAGGNPQP